MIEDFLLFFDLLSCILGLSGEVMIRCKVKNKIYTKEKIYIYVCICISNNITKEKNDQIFSKKKKKLFTFTLFIYFN